jgi:hypothetical protein
MSLLTAAMPSTWSGVASSTNGTGGTGHNRHGSISYGGLASTRLASVGPGVGDAEEQQEWPVIEAMSQEAIEEMVEKT